jgi:hypothetical protein
MQKYRNKMKKAGKEIREGVGGGVGETHGRKNKEF